MLLEEIYGNWQSKQLTEDEAALLLGISTRTFRLVTTLIALSGAESSLTSGLAGSHTGTLLWAEWCRFLRRLIETTRSLSDNGSPTYKAQEFWCSS